MFDSQKSDSPFQYIVRKFVCVCVLCVRMHANKNSRTRDAANVSAALYTLLAAALAALLLRVFAGTALRAHVSLDRRSLAAGRVLLGSLVVVDVWRSRWPFRRLLYSDEGMWPRALVLAGRDPQIQPSRDVSLYLAFGGAGWASAACASAAIAGICAAVGFHTQLALGYCWLHLYSMAYRCSGCQQAGDTLMRMVMFWSMFLPCGDVWSIDSVLFTPSLPANCAKVLFSPHRLPQSLQSVPMSHRANSAPGPPSSQSLSKA